MAQGKILDGLLREESPLKIEKNKGFKVLPEKNLYGYLVYENGRYSIGLSKFSSLTYQNSEYYSIDGHILRKKNNWFKAGYKFARFTQWLRIYRLQDWFSKIRKPRVKT